MAGMSLDTAIRLSAEVKGANNITKVQRSLQDLALGSKTTARDMQTLRAATFQYARANDGTIAGIRNSITAFRGLQEQANIGSREFQRYGTEIQKLEGKLRGIDGTAEKAGKSMGQNLAAGLAAGLAAAGVGQAIRGSLESVVASEESQRRLRSLSQGLDDYSRVQATATAAAQKFGVAQTQANQEFAQIYARLRPVGLTLEEISTVYNGFNTAAKLSGTTSAEAGAAFLQLSQALGTGVLRGEELNSVFEQTPAVVQGIAQVMGVPIGQIRDLAKEGKITGDIVLEALKRIERDGAPKLADAMKGPAQQFKNLQIAGQDLQIQLGQALLPTALALANAALAMAQGFNSLPGPVKNTAIAVGIATTAALGLVAAIAALNAGLALLGGATAIKAAIAGMFSLGGAATTATGVITGLKAAMLAIPGVGWAAAAIIGTGLLGKAAYDTNETFRNFVDNIGGVLAADFRSAVDGMATDARASAGDIDETYKGLAKGMEPAADFIRQLFKDVFKDTSDSAQVSATQSSNAFNDFFTSLSTSATAGFAGLNTIISNWWSSLSEPIRNIFGGNTASMLAGAAQYAGGAASRAAAPNAQASGMYGRYAPGGAQVSFAQPAAAPNATAATNSGADGGGAAKKQAESMGAQIAKSLQQALDLTPAQSAGVVGNLMRESGLNPRVNEGGAVGAPRGVGGYGLAQWTGTRQKDLVRFAGGSAAAGDLQTQLRFMVSELMGPESRALASLRKTTTPEDAAVAFDRDYERSGVKALPERKANARRVYGEIAGSGPGAGLGDFADQLKLQADAAEKLREQKQAADELLITERNRLEILQEVDPMQKKIIESMNQGLEIEKKFQDLISASPEQKKTLELAQQYAIKSNTLELERELSNLAKDAVKPLQDAVTEAGNRLAYEREYGELLSKGINPELAKQFVELDRIATAAKTNLELQIAMLEVKLAELPVGDANIKNLERQIELRKEQLKLIPGTVAETKEIMTTTGTKAKSTPGQDITARIGVLKGEIKDLTDIGQVAITSADNIGNAFGSAFQGLISGSMSAREALAGFFKDVAEGFIEMAAQIIAKQMAMIVLQSILKALGAVAGASGGGGFGAGGAGFGGSNSFGSFDAGGALAFGGGLSFAGGGYTGNAPRAGGVDGQGGFPAILHPRETVIDHTRSMAVPYQRSATAPATAPAMEVPYQRSGPAMAVPFQKAAGGAAGDSMSTTIDVKFETVRIGNVDYVTRDEAEQIGRQSAQRGADLASKRYRNSPSARRRDGIS